jgi:hypothetical protein
VTDKPKASAPSQKKSTKKSATSQKASSQKASSQKASSQKASAQASTSKPAAPKKAPRSLPILVDVADLPVEETALSAQWPEAVLALSDPERKARVRQGLDTVLLDDVDPAGRRAIRGFVKAVLRVPLSAPKGRVYGVFVEVDRAAYVSLQRAFVDKVATEVTGRLATRLPFLDDAYGSEVVVVEDGSDQRARVVRAQSASLRDGPTVGPRSPGRAKR